MPDADKQKKKVDIEKLRMILDNPRGTQPLAQDDPCLETLRRRLGGGVSEEHLARISSQIPSSHPDFLKPRVTIHGPEEKKPPLPREDIRKEPPMLIQKQVKPPLQIDAKDLYEIEKPEPEKAPLPEWKIVEEPEEKPVREWIPVASPLPPQEPILEKPKEPVEKHEETPVPRIVRDGKLDVFKEVTCIDPPTAQLLYEKGFSSVESLRASSLENLIRNGVEKRVACRIKKELIRTDRKKAKQTKKAVRKVTVSVETVPFTQKKPGQDIPLVPQKTELAIQEKPVESIVAPPEEENVPVWEPVEIKKPVPRPIREKPKPVKEKKKRFLLGRKKPDTVTAKPIPQKKKTKQKPPKPRKTKPATPVKPVEIIITPPPKEKKVAPPKVVRKKPELVKEPKSRFWLRKKKEVTVKETVIRESEEWVQRPERKPIKTIPSPIPKSTEWELSSKVEEKPLPVEKKPVPMVMEQIAYQFEDYRLYKKEIATLDGKLRTIHFFSKTTPHDGTPASLPEGFEVDVNKKTGLPYLRKKEQL
ncbi:MAG: hypothetical protein V1726_02710 [Methanobacteriota archaeon]